MMKILQCVQILILKQNKMKKILIQNNSHLIKVIKKEEINHQISNQTIPCKNYKSR